MPSVRRFAAGLNARALGRIAPAAIFPLVVLIGLTLHTVNVPMYDEWIWSPLVVKMHDGTLTAGDLWAQQASHRSFVPTAIALALARIDGWDTRIEAACSLFFAVLTQVLLGVLFVRRLGTRAAAPFLFASALLCSLAQSENWVWGFQLSWFIVDACIVAVVVLLDRDAQSQRALRMCLAVVAAIAASYSLIFGFAGWIAGAVVLGRNRLAFVWWACAAICAAVFFTGYRLPADERGWAAGSALTDVPQFFLAYLGSPLGGFGGRWLAEILGAVVIVAGGSLAVRARRDAAPWLALSSIALFAATLDTIGRAANGIDAATAFRYTTPASFAWIALVGLAAEAQLPRLTLTICRFSLAALLVFANAAGYVYGYVLIGMQRSALTAIRTVEAADDDELGEYANDPAMLRRDVAQLRAADLGPFIGGATSSPRAFSQ